MLIVKEHRDVLWLVLSGFLDNPTQKNMFKKKNKHKYA